MEVAFFGKLRDVGSSLIVTVPSEIVEHLKLKAGHAYQFKIEVELSEPERKEEGVA